MERLEVKFASEASEEGIIEGLASPFGGAPDRVDDIVAPGAYSKSLAEHGRLGTMPAMLLFHDHTAPPGAWLEMEETREGLRVRGKFDLETPIGSQAYAMAKARSITGLSIGFRTIKATRLPGGVRRLDEVDLMEVSLVTVPAAPAARITSVKSNPALPPANPERTPVMTTEANAAAGGEQPKAPETKTAPPANPAAEVAEAVKAIVAPFIKRIEEMEVAMKRPGAAPEDKAAKSEAAKAFEGYIRHGAQFLHLPEAKSLVVSDDSSAGFLAPPEFIAEVDKDIVQFSPMRRLATVRNTTRGQVELPRRVGRPSATWVEEIRDDEPGETETTYGLNSYAVKELTAYIDVSFSTLEDAGVDVFAELGADFAEEFGAAEGTAFVTGPGTTRPLGFMNDSNIQAVNSGNGTAITADGLIDLFHGLPAPYRANATWAMNSTTMAAVRKLKTGDGQYLAMLSGINGAPATTILGRPVEEFPDMPDIGAGTYPIAFGDFRLGYRVFDRVGFSLLRDDLTQRTKGKARFHARRRVAGGVRRAEAIRKMIIAA